MLPDTNLIVQNEVEALKAIFGHEWQFLEGYPETSPKIWLLNDTGIGEGRLGSLNEVVHQMANDLLGSEMIYEIANCISDYITENNSIIQPQSVSAHDLMKSRNLIETEKSLIQNEKIRATMEKLKDKNLNLLAEKVKQEIIKKQSLKKDEQDRRRKLSSSNAVVSSTRTFDEVTLSPITKGGCQVAWCTLDPNFVYLVETIDFDAKQDLEILEKRLNSAKSFRHQSAPILYDWDILITAPDKGVLRVLTNDFKQVSVASVIGLGECISIANATSILSGFLNLAEELQNETLYIEASDIWFDSSNNPVFAGVTYPNEIGRSLMTFTVGQKYPNWNLHDTPSCQIGVLILEMIVGDLAHFQSPLECAAKLSKINRDLGDFAQLILEPETRFNDLKRHPFFQSGNQLYKKLDLVSSSSIQTEVVIHTAPKDIKTVSRYHSDFEEIEFLGRGGFGSVVKVRNVVDGRLYAVKRIKLNPLDNNASKRLIREVQTLSRLQSEYIVRYYQAWFEETDAASSDGGSEESFSITSDSYESNLALSDSEGYESDDWLSSHPRLNNNPQNLRLPTTYTQVLYIQMEYCDKKTLRNVIDSGLSLEQGWAYLRQLLEGLNHLHASGVIHRDLKPSNIFLDNDKRVKIGDFGLATAKKDTSRNTLLSTDLLLTTSSNMAESSLTSQIGTTVYIAPEIMNGIGRYNSKVDLFSLGIVFFEMIYKMNTTMQRMQVLHDLRKEGFVFPSDFLMTDAGAVIRKMLDHNPRARPSCAALLQSPLIPASIEEEYINEDLLRIVKQRNPSYYSRLMSTLFQQVTEVHKDFAYDYNGNQIFNPLTSLVSSSVHLHVLRVFRKHGGVQINCPMMLPKSKTIAEIYGTKRTSEFLDINGDVVALPHDLTFPFARALAQSNEEGITFPIKRFTIDKVFRKNTTGGQPRFVDEADFDIVYEKGLRDDMIPEAEVVKVALEILEFGGQDYQIHINYSTTLFKILNAAAAPEHLHSAILECLSSLKKLLTIGQTKQNLLKIGLPKETVEKICSFSDMALVVTSKTDIASLIELTDSPEDIIQFASNLETMGITNYIFLDPLFVYNPSIFSGFFLQICRKNQSKLDVIAAGGRYESLIDKIRSPFINRKDINAVGINIALSKFVSNIAALQPQEDSKIHSACKKADVLLICMGQNHVLVNIRLSIAAELWQAGLNCDLSLHLPLSNIEDLSKHRFDYNYAVILKPKGGDSYTIKVRNLALKTEVEVQRSAIVSSVQVPQKAFQKSSMHQSFDSDVEVPSPTSIAKSVEVVILPGSGVKKRRPGKAVESQSQNWVLLEKASNASLQLYLKSKVLVVDIGSNDISRLHSLWTLDNDILKNIKTEAPKDYLLQIKKQLIKMGKEDDHISLVWLFSTSEQRCYPLSLSSS